jgi:hypothetical protein
MSQRSYERINFVGSSAELPACDAYIDWLGFPRNKADFWDDCSDQVFPKDPKYRIDSTPYKEIVENKRELCSSWYNDPWVGSAKICDGTPYQNEYLEWVCQPGTECEAP